MKRFVVLIIITVLLSSTTAITAGGASILERISKSESREQVQVFLGFDRLPRHDEKRSDRRFDIILHDTVPADKLTVFEQDETIVKILTSVHEEATVVSFFFRYPPQKATVSTDNDRTLVLEILPGNRFSKTYDEVSRQLSGITLLDREGPDYTNPLLSSPYAHDWRSFFYTYETEPTLTAPVSFTIPDFPLVAAILPGETDYRELLDGQLLERVDRQSWAEMAPLLEQRLQATQDLQTGKYLALLYGDVLLRMNHFEGAYKQLYLLRQSYPEEQVGVLAAYLLAILLAVNDDPYTADSELRALAQKFPPRHPLTPHYLISLAETSLATRQFEQLRRVLERTDVAYPPPLLAVRALRQADLLYATDRSVQAFVSYRLLPDPVALRQRPFSLNAFCATLYEQKNWQETTSCYQDLTQILTERQSLGMASFRTAMAGLHRGDASTEIAIQLGRIEDTFPNTEAAFRAAVKHTDLRYLDDSAWHPTAQTYYHALAEESPYRAVSGEAYFKEALLYHLHNDDATAIVKLMTLTRNIRSGSIVPHAEALLIQILPGEIRRLIEAGSYLEAVVLSRQNRRFFDNNWFDTALLTDLALAHERLGSYREALDLYLYLASQATSSEREQFYLPLARSAYARGDFSLVEDFADQYNFNFPDGRYAHDILLLKIKSLYMTDQFDRALKLLPEPLPDRPDFKELAATLHFHAQQFETTANLLEELARSADEPTDETVFMRAESLFQIGRNDEATELFRRCRDQATCRGQSLYRLSQLAERRGDTREALNLLQELAETTDDSLWRQLAQKELQTRPLFSP
ncbi:MAG: tetratricopeptide repeat protein [Desulfobulbaceae bacterium]|nr:tetratricopeptide repeat protein [Desulfobulbaceae bacterium]